MINAMLLCICWTKLWIVCLLVGWLALVWWLDLLTLFGRFLCGLFACSIACLPSCKLLVTGCPGCCLARLCAGKEAACLHFCILAFLLAGWLACFPAFWLGVLLTRLSWAILSSAILSSPELEEAKLRWDMLCSTNLSWAASRYSELISAFLDSWAKSSYVEVR